MNKVKPLHYIEITSDLKMDEKEYTLSDLCAILEPGMYYLRTPINKQESGTIIIGNTSIVRQE